jgi:hypothetical protein
MEWEFRVSYWVKLIAISFLISLAITAMAVMGWWLVMRFIQA